MEEQSRDETAVMVVCSVQHRHVVGSVKQAALLQEESEYTDTHTEMTCFKAVIMLRAKCPARGDPKPSD